MTIFEKKTNDIKKCPICGNDIVIKNGIYGKFYGCSNFPRCKYSESIKIMLIFDMDGTVFDTDSIRIARNEKKLDINNCSKENIKLIEGFEDIFCDKSSKLYLPNCKCVFVTNSGETYAKYLLNLYNDVFGELDYKLYPNCSTCRIQIINDIIKRNEKTYNTIIAFGDDEKDALIYSIVGVKYYIVNNYYGYNDFDSLKKDIEINRINFRNNYQYDIVKLKSRRSIFNEFGSKYFDDIVIYYKRYYDKNNSIKKTHSMKNAIELKKLTYKNFGCKKVEVTKKYAKKFVDEDYNDLVVSKDVVFAKVPGSKETKESNDSAMKYIIDALSEKYGINKNYNDLLLRKSSVETNHHNKNANRNIQKHLDTIYVTRKIKGKIVYLFDDITSTGASMIACVEKLYEADAGHVVCFTLARTCNEDGYYFIELDGRKR